MRFLNREIESGVAEEIKSFVNDGRLRGDLDGGMRAPLPSIFSRLDVRHILAQGDRLTVTVCRGMRNPVFDRNAP
jgi:hypothetical protein